MSVDSGQRLAELALGTWIEDSVDRWKLVTASYARKKTSGRIDRTYTFERVGRRIGGAPIRTEIIIAGDTPARVRPYVEIPESFRRRYTEMRSWNEPPRTPGDSGVPRHCDRRDRRPQQIRARAQRPLARADGSGGVIGALALLAGINKCLEAGSCTIPRCRRRPFRPRSFYWRY